MKCEDANESPLKSLWTFLAGLLEEQDLNVCCFVCVVCMRSFLAL